MIIGTMLNGNKCVYDLPAGIKTTAELESLIYGFNNGRMAESQREELYNQPKLLGLNGPMFGGFGTLKSTGETVAIIRYENLVDISRNRHPWRSGVGLQPCH